MKRLALAAMLLASSSLSFAATLTSLNANQAKNILANKTITTISTITMDGSLVAKTFTGYFDKNGTMTGKIDPKPDNGPENDKGTWMVKANGNLCFKWDNWDNNQEKCVMLYKLNNALLVVAPSNKLETLILDSNIQSGNQLS